jgi:adsorption protein B
MSVLDSWITAGLILFAVWILASSLDDLVVDLACLWQWVRRRLFRACPVGVPTPAELDRIPEQGIAIFVPLWREHRVIARMLEHNIAALRYRNYHFIVGAYPNDQPTLEAMRECERRFPNVHLTVCPHDGPTSKADCLNWIYQGMLRFEEQHSLRFKLVVLHDAEDVIHPESLRLVNYFARCYDMVQIPVLPLANGFRNFTHGIYCDEFAEFQSRDLPVRQVLGGFLPSSGVGAGYSRRALEQLGAASGGRIFEPGCLTEDYDIGYRLHRLGCSQVFVPIRLLDGNPVATREFFPDNVKNAIRQRTRWVIGIALQAWEKHGWGAGVAQRYWFWRDRKGLVGNPVTFLVNLVFFYGLGSWLWSWRTGAVWELGRVAAHPATAGLLCGTLFFQLLRVGVRMLCVARIYGLRFALGVPLRVCWGNWINFFATAAALRRYLLARLGQAQLTWFKTEHVYPSRSTLMNHKRRMGEILVGAGRLDPKELQRALESKPAGVRLGEHLVEGRRLAEEEVYKALSVQQNLPFGRLDPKQVPHWLARSLPLAVAQRFKLLPFKVEPGRLFVASPELPSDEMQQELRKFTRLDIQFHLITPSNLAELARELLKN